jgi:hypothetical protein
MKQGELLDMVMYFVERDELNQKGRQREKIYKKCFLMSKLHEFKITLSEIGRLFNQKHSSVIHNVKTHKDMMKWNTAHYESYIYEYMEEFKDVNYIEPQRNLVKDIMECENIFQLRKIKKAIWEKKYGDDATLIE